MYKKSSSFVYKFVVNCHIFGRISSGCTLWSWKLAWMITSAILFETGITKPCTQLHPAPPSSTQLHPAPPSSFQPPPSSLQHPQQYLNQNIARNWAISPNLGQKFKSCSFWLKIGTHGILEMLIPNPALDFWNSDPKIHFWANLCPKIQTFPFCLKIGARSISRMLIPNPDLDLWNVDPKIYFWANLDPKTQSFPFYLKIGSHGISRMLILIPIFVFWIPNPNFLFGQIWAKKVKVVRFNWKLVHMVSWKCRFRIRT